ncbi:hypothetical protein [Tardiphaga sp.]|jgi:hypothetical protein|uniref:hypothetical protein n=1 Tax=Tardiphaga sp. TaxID=1926292 RepID=UPI0037D9C3AF
MYLDFKVSDIVTRDGSDRQRVVETDGHSPPMTITVECIREPATDELSPEPWCKLGEREFNLARRYGYAHDAIDGEFTVIAGKLAAPHGERMS